MKYYQVYQNGKACSEYKIKGWETDTFSTFEEAAKFAVKWAYPCNIENYKDWPHPIELNTPIDMSYSEFSVMMEIKLIEVN